MIWDTLTLMWRHCNIGIFKPEQNADNFFPSVLFEYNF